ncbi:MAG: endolytic transglycosylase MltG [Gammaproteobacteria bacterium]|nr:endolytic transglycosylase MltG [Gammaproteobacteria bacterium]
MLSRYSKTRQALIAVAVFILLITFYFSVKIYNEMHKAFSLTETQNIVFSRGSNIRTLARQLIEKDLLDDKTYFLLWGKLQRQTTRLQAGEYQLTPGLSLAGLLDNMVAGEVIQYNLSLIEGFTFRQILKTIQKSPVLTIELKGLSDNAIMKRLGHEGEHPEGRFYPDTYYISRGETDIDLLTRAYDAMQIVLADEWSQRAEGLPYKTPYEALVMASIVEKESAIAEERPLIAGLFVNRLRINMRLQTDPTVIYGIKNYDGNIRFRDLRKDTPYNTYTRSGLPPTPIALPGREAIHATLHPDNTKYLYFVAYSDGSGRHVFSTNLKDHEKAVDEYQRKKR